jgi:putative DNA primase/helicase
LVYLREQRKEDYCTKATTVGADLEGDCPLWKAFLPRAMAGDQGMVGYLQRVCGYCLTGYVSEHKMFFLWGTGANGKSTFAGVLLGILGTGPTGYAAVAPISTFTASQTEQHPTDLAMLQGVRCVIAHETEQGRAWATSKIKMITGGDLITARFMRRDFFTYQPQFKLVILGNHKPVLLNVDDAIRRRLDLIPFTVTIPKDERDPRLPEKLKAEYPQILGWMAKGFDEWQRIGLASPAKVRDATSNYLATEDNVSNWIADRCVFDAEAHTTLKVLFASWKDWCDKNGERFPGPSKQLTKALDARPELKRRTTRTNLAAWCGIKLRDAPDPQDDLPLDEPRPDDARP